MVKAGYRLDEIRSMSRPEIEARLGLIQKTTVQRRDQRHGKSGQGRRLISKRQRIVATS